MWCNKKWDTHVTPRAASQAKTSSVWSQNQTLCFACFPLFSISNAVALQDKFTGVVACYEGEVMIGD